jgi:hypothetical protein
MFHVEHFGCARERARMELGWSGHAITLCGAASSMEIAGPGLAGRASRRRSVRRWQVPTARPVRASAKCSTWNILSGAPAVTTPNAPANFEARLARHDRHEPLRPPPRRQSPRLASARQKCSTWNISGGRSANLPTTLLPPYSPPNQHLPPPRPSLAQFFLQKFPSRDAPSLPTAPATF